MKGTEAEEKLRDDELNANTEWVKGLNGMLKEWLNRDQELAKACDQAVSDILHDMELSKLDGVGLVKEGSALRNLLRRRRQVKTRISTMQSIMPHVQAAAKSLEKRQGRVLSYEPRILTGLKYGQEEKELLVEADA